MTTALRRAAFRSAAVHQGATGQYQAAGATLQGVMEKLVGAGVPTGEALTRAQALIYATVQKQSSLRGFLDLFWLVCLIALAAIPLVLLIKNIRRGAPADSGH